MPDKKQRRTPFTTISSRIAWSCPWYSVREDQILLPDGQMGVYNVLQHSGAVFVVPVTAEGKVILINHYRHTVGEWCWEVPAGGLHDGQSPLGMAKVELREEVGGEASNWTHIGQFYPSNGISNESAHVFLAQGVTLHETAREPTEVLEVQAFPVARAIEMARQNEISDGSSALAILLCEPYLHDLNLIDEE